VLVFRDGRQVAIVAGAQADRLRPKLENSPEEAQHALARVTGNYPRRQRTSERSPLKSGSPLATGDGEAVARSAPMLELHHPP
jgi:hypothetical protein